MEQQIFFNDFKCGFCLRNKKAQHPQSVYGRFLINGKQYKINIGAKAYSSYLQRNFLPKNKNEQHNYEIFLSYVNVFNLAVIRLKSYLCNTNPANTDEISQAVSKFFKYNMRKKKTEKDLITILAEQITLSSARKSSKNQYYTILNDFERFIKTQNVDNVIKSSTYSTMLKYQQYLTKQGITPKTINNRITVLSTLLRSVSRNEQYHYNINESKTLEIKKLKVEKDEFEDFTFTEDELTELYNNNANLTPKEIELKDLFILLCLTGQRISD